MAKKVIILGGGVGGMSAAHELVERGFDVEVYERQKIPGGKARSIPVDEALLDRGQAGVHGRAIDKWRRMRGPELAPHESRPWLPGEHGFRFFPGFYRHIVDTMDRIPYPYGQGKVSDNLVDTSQILLSRFGGGDFVLPSRFPRTPQGVQAVLEGLLNLLKGNLGISVPEMGFFATRLWQVMTSSEERRLDEYEKIGWWDFINAAQFSQDYQKFFGHGITRSLVASQAHLASARTIGNIFLQLVLDIADPTVATSDRLLNGPSNDVWIRPWLNYLEAQGVKYHINCKVESINCLAGVVQSVTVENHGALMEVTGDHFIAALPVERMLPLITSGLTEAEPRLSHLPELATKVAWMNGIQFYLERPVPIAHGHVIYIDTPWALTSVSQAQFWPDFPISHYSDGDAQDILSIDVSDWNTPGLNGKTARECTREEIAREVFDQIKLSLNAEGREVLPEKFEDLDYWFLDPDIRRDTEEERQFLNVEPLLVNLKDTWRLRPEAVTSIPNFYLASDYVRTYTDLATMEAANEAARRAVNGILDASGSSATPCRLWKLHEPEILFPYRELDRARWEAGLPWKDPLHVSNLFSSTLGAGEKPSGLPLDEIGSLSGLPGTPAPVGSLSRAMGEGGPAGNETLLQVAKHVLSIVEGGAMGTSASGEGRKEANRCPEYTSSQETEGTTVKSGNPSHGRIRIEQKY